MKMQLSRNGIAHNLEISPYKHKVNYENDELEFVFSSQRYVNKFIDELKENRSKINESLTKRFGFTIENNMLADIKLYMTIEIRGFLIKGKEDFKCLNTIKLDGQTMTKKS